MVTKTVRAFEDTAEQVGALADELGMSRPAVLRLLVTRYGDALRLELSSPVRLAPGDLRAVGREGGDDGQ